MHSFLKSGHIQNYQIIIIEDDVALNTLIQKTLQKNNYLTRGFYTGHEAIEWLRKNHYPSIHLLLDSQHYGISEERVVWVGRKDNIELPFVIITEQGDVITTIEMMKLGAQGCA